MQNLEIIKLIENLKGRRGYEEKKATKLGFSSLYAYLEDKILKQKRVLEDRNKQSEKTKSNTTSVKKEKKICDCC
jgi:hypothetical protein|tara:strand:- start:653 stop:877 length:225 start_codon:yes stop_codon:yes gene_type:complete